MTGPRVPTATYRLQFHADFGFRDATRLIPYLARLGISDLYASPLLQARSGSTHGYDVTDITRLNPVLGTQEDFEELVAELKRHDMGLLLDFVPNHMAAHPENPWWMDVLTYGVASPYSGHFDINWFPESTQGVPAKLMLPVLGGPYGQVLENHELQLQLENGALTLRYWEHAFPLHPRTYGSILHHRRERLQEMQVDPSALEAYEAMLKNVDALAEAPEPRSPASLGSSESSDAEESAAYLRQSEAVRQALRELCDRHPVIHEFLAENVHHLNGVQGDPRSFDRLDALLNEQVYRLAHWRMASEAVNYRRFFDINDLVGMRVNDPLVFRDMHERILSLAHEGAITGLRLDHIDGLYDPRAYLAHLQTSLPGSPDASPRSTPGFYVIVEKIVGHDERIPDDWPVSGTTGYEFLNHAQGVFVDHNGLRSLNRTYARFTGTNRTFGDVVYASKKQVLRQLFSGEMQRFGAWLQRLAANDRYARDLPEAELERAMREVTACFPVYRTFTQTLTVSPRDLAYIDRALDEARERTSHEEVSDLAYAFLRRVLTLSPLPDDPDECEAWLAFVRRWQQFTGPATAKGLEDTAFYRHNRLISLNAVGGDIQEVEHPVHVDGFHRFNQVQQQEWPHSLNTTSTHDTKRSGDVEMRINVLSEVPRAWARRFNRWSRATARWKQQIHGQIAPDPHEEIFIYQTLLGAWPLRDEDKPQVRERMKVVVRKALREAKVHTNWIRPDLEYEAGVLEFVDAILHDVDTGSFLSAFEPFQRRLAAHGAWNALGQLVLKVASPGIPDIYQGNELWDFSLVDPDNRRPVDFQQRMDFLAALERVPDDGTEDLLSDLLHHWWDARIKLFTTYKALRHRRSESALYREGAYLPLTPTGTHARFLCAFARRKDNRWIIAVIPRLTTHLTRAGTPPIGKRIWARTMITLPDDSPAQLTNLFTNEQVSAGNRRGKARHLAAGDVLHRFPVALLASG